MRTATRVVFAIGAAAMVPFVLHMSSAGAAEAQATMPIAGIDDSAMAGSARASKLIGRTVYEGDASVGTIEDVLISRDHTTLAAVILSVGGFLGVGDKLVAIPISDIKIGSEAKYTTDLTKEQLTNAPAFEFGKLN